MNFKLRKAIQKQNEVRWDRPIFDSDNPLPDSERELRQMVADCRRMRIDRIYTSEQNLHMSVLSALNHICHQAFSVADVPFRVEQDYLTHRDVHIYEPGIMINIQ